MVFLLVYVLRFLLCLWLVYSAFPRNVSTGLLFGLFIYGKVGLSQVRNNQIGQGRGNFSPGKGDKKRYDLFKNPLASLVVDEETITDTCDAN